MLLQDPKLRDMEVETGSTFAPVSFYLSEDFLRMLNLLETFGISLRAVADYKGKPCFVNSLTKLP